MRPDDEDWWMWERGIQFGYDASILLDGDRVYALKSTNRQLELPRTQGRQEGRTWRVDYFHDTIDGIAIAKLAQPQWEQTVDPELHALATQLINADWGYTTARITNLQRRWRKRMAQRMGTRVKSDGTERQRCDSTEHDEGEEVDEPWLRPLQVEPEQRPNHVQSQHK